MKISLLSVLGMTSYVAAFLTDANRSISQRKLFRSNTSLNFGIPTFGAKDSEEEEKNAPAETQNAKKEIGWKGLIQLITAGAGSPFLGDFEGVDEETGKFMFSLEANNLVDESGQSKQTQAPYFESGWVSEEDLEKEKKRKEGGGFKFW